MIPAHWMALDAMPRNRNGKTDRPLLAQWFDDQRAGGSVVAHSAPEAGIAAVQS